MNGHSAVTKALELTNLDTAACKGMSALFDSCDWRDHIEAKAICDDCDAILACASRLIEVRKGCNNGGMPQGTWAGQLYGSPHRERNESKRAKAEAGVLDERRAS